MLPFIEDENYLNKEIFETAQFIAELMFKKCTDTDVLELVRGNISFMLADYIKIQENKVPPLEEIKSGED